MILYRKMYLERIILILALLIGMISSPVEAANNNDELILGKAYHGFTLADTKTIEEIQSTAYVFIHKQSGARLLYLKNEDDNKVFSIAFRTPPEDDTGVQHIMEHSVLCGSKKYPVKDPFLQMSKQSLSTFLNALTYPDMTMYPVSSRNDKDFRNLMDVYLDAVLYPNVYKNEKIFMQEGWHYELDSKDDELSIKGIVYNEMKGSYSSPEEILFNTIRKTLYPDTPYRHDSGGNPEKIPTLSREKFLKLHSEYYHPSNSYIYLYGDIDIMDHLKYINDSYLKKFKKINIYTKVPIQIPFKERQTVTNEYPVLTMDDTNKGTYLALSFVVDNILNKDNMIIIDILNHLLLGSPGSPLKKALIEADFGDNAYGDFDTYMQQPMFTIVVENSEEKHAKEFQQVVQTTLKKIVKEGFDKKLIDSNLNSYEVNLHASNSAADKGLTYNDDCMKSWLYDGDPTSFLELQSTIESMRKNMNVHYFDKYIEDFFIDNNHSAMVILNPNPGMEERQHKNIKDSLARTKSQMNEEQLETIIKSTKELKKWQNKSDTKTALRKIPSLSRNELKREVEEIPIERREENEIRILNHPMYTNGLAYLDMYFDASKVPQDKILYLHLLCEMLGQVSTEKQGYINLSNEINMYTGSLDIGMRTFSKYGNDGIYYPKLNVAAYSLEEKLPQTLKLIGEIVANSKFSDSRRIHGLIKEAKSEMQGKISEESLMIAAKRTFSYFSPVEKYNEYGMLPYYYFLCDLDKNYSKKSKEIAANLKEVANTVLNKDRLIVSITADEPIYKTFKDNFKFFAEQLKDSNVQESNYAFAYDEKNEGLMIPSKVQYVVKGYNFKKLGYDYNGSMKVLLNILDSDYFWQEIRVKGGAYGAFSEISANGNMAFMSFDDPNLKETLNVFDKAVEYLKKFKADEREMTNFIIGTIGSMDAPKSPWDKGKTSDRYYISGITQDNIQKERDEILKTTAEDIKLHAVMIDKIMQRDYYCVVGDKTKLQNNKMIFRSLVDVYK